MVASTLDWTADLSVEFRPTHPHRFPVPGKLGPCRLRGFKFVLDPLPSWLGDCQGDLARRTQRCRYSVPPRHDLYTRFLSAAWPYYVGAIMTSVEFLIFAALWLARDVNLKEER
jgi:hypothetical protein